MNEEARPDPQELLKAISQEEIKQNKGRLKIFLGMSAGVGKTYAMLEEAQKLKSLGVNVYIGVVETHGRHETAKLLEGLTVIPLLEMTYRGTGFKELNLDQILKVKPQLILVDELAHTNVPGSRHDKRWQDILELLENGIDVYSTLNVQHVESLRDHIESIAEIPIRETVPDKIIELADSIELVDITPSALLQRLKEGKVYLGERSEIAARHFFKEDRLSALREMALRFAAEKVDHDLKGMISVVERPFGWKTRERLLVAISPNEHSQKLIRTTRRLAFNLNAPWLALYVNQDTPLSDEEKVQLDRNFALARDLGAEVITTTDPDVAVGVQRIAKQRGVTQIVLGHPPKNKFWGLLYRPSLMDKLAQHSDDVDLHIMRRVKTIAESKKKLFFSKSRILTFLVGVAFVTLLAFASWLLMDEWIWLLALYAFLGIGVGVIADQARRQAEMLAKREATAQALFTISKEIASSPSVKLVLPMVKRELETILGGKCEIVIKRMDEEGLDFSSASDIGHNEKEQAVASWVYDNETEAGWSTSTLPASEYFYLPLKGFTEAIGVLAFRSHHDKKLSLDSKNFLYTTGFQIATHIERLFTQKREQNVVLLHQKEKIYQSILDLMSEQFKLPLENIRSALQNLDKNDYTQVIGESVDGLVLILENISAMAQLRSGLSPIQKESYRIEEVIEASRDNIRKSLGKHQLKISIEANLPKMVFDFYLIEILICNLLFNAIENSPANGHITLEAREEEGILILSVTDYGSKMGPDGITAVFEKFYRVPGTLAPRLSLGLAVAKTIAEIHGGVIIASTLPSRGNKFSFHLPIKKAEL